LCFEEPGDQLLKKFALVVALVPSALAVACSASGDNGAACKTFGDSLHRYAAIGIDFPSDATPPEGPFLTAQRDLISTAKVAAAKASGTVKKDLLAVAAMSGHASLHESDGITAAIQKDCKL
jgi:hypothetical protein